MTNYPSPPSEKPEWIRPDARRGRGAVTSASGRFEGQVRVKLDDGWGSMDEEQAPLKTTLQEDKTRSIIAYNASPDLPFDRSINPYRGCEHGCIYCFARPTHAYLGLSPGLDFETRLFYKPRAAELLEAELRAKSYKPRPIAMGTNTDPYQPSEKKFEITRSIIKILSDFNHPFGIVTKSHLVTRDIDLIAPMAKRGLARVAISVTTLDHRLARRMEPRASTPARRLDAIKQLTEAGIPVGVMIAPVIPGLTDHEIEKILETSYEAGARSAGLIPLRLPHEVKTLFREWLAEIEPNRLSRVMDHVTTMRGGNDNDPRFGDRMRGIGPYAEIIAQRFEKAVKRIGFECQSIASDLSQFRVPPRPGDQLPLF
jgi:DNA repair photolyase